MPELAEVELAKRIWETGGQEPITQLFYQAHARIYRHTPAHALEQLCGQKVTASFRHGKRLFFTFTSSLHLELHLGMTGKMVLSQTPYLPKKHDHLILFSEQTARILNDYRMFGKVVLHQTVEPWKDLPPDPLSEAFTPSLLHHLLSTKPNLALKNALLRQDLFPGIGNWMADEICWQLRTHPSRPLRAVDPDLLYQTVRAVCQGALRYITEGNLNTGAASERGFSAGQYVAKVPPLDWLFQHRWKKGGSCPRCQSPLARGPIASRTTAWCPTCQPD